MFRRQLNRLANLMSRLTKQPDDVKVGVIKGRYPSGASVAEVAYFNEFGTRDIPARPFMRTGTHTYVVEWHSQRASIWAAVMRGDMRQRQALELMGVAARDYVIAAIDSNIAPHNAPSTIRQKGSSHTLIDTGRLKQSITYELVRNGLGGRY